MRNLILFTSSFGLVAGVVLLLLLGGSLLVQPIEAMKEPDAVLVQEFQIGENYLRNGEILESLGHFDGLTARTDNPEFLGRCYFTMGGIYGYFLDQKDEAFEQYTKVIHLAADQGILAESIFNCGMILYERDRYTEALDHFKRYINEFPDATNRMTAEFMIEQCEIELQSAIIVTPTPQISIVPARECRVTMTENTAVRVLLAEKISSIVIEGQGSAHAVCDDTGTKTTIVLPATFQVRGSLLRVEGSSLEAKRINLTGAEDSFLRVGGVMYRGSLRLLVNNGQLSLINVLPCEDYLRGVLPKEVSASWDIEALKSQAVTARTYVLFHVEKSKDKLYDVSATVASQVYGGVSVEKESTDRAVQETRGQVLCHDNKLIIACFHSNSGGYTEDSKNVWVADLPYLSAVPDRYSEGTPNFSWEASLSIDDVEKKLLKRGISVGSLKRVEIVDFSKSGRAITIRLEGSRGERTLKSNEFRLIIDPMLIKSTRFSIEHSTHSLAMKGTGFGHGVGLPQWSAYRMAREGKQYRDILSTYFPNVVVAKVY